MQWKKVLLEIFVVAVISVISLRLLGAGTGQSLKSLEDSFSNRFQAIETRLQNMETTLAEARGSGSGPMQPVDSNKNISQKLQKLTERLANLEKRIDSRSASLPSPTEMPAPPVGADLSPPSPTGMGPSKPLRGADPLGWLNRLPEDKRSQVEEVMRSHAMALREGIGAIKSEGNGAAPPNPDAIRSIMEQNEQELKESMKSILSPEDYQQFLDSLPRHRRSAPRAPDKG